MALALYRKYRPQNFREITNQNHVKITLESEVATAKVAHAYVFSGPRGTGKTSMARIFAKAINCTSRQPTANSQQLTKSSKLSAVSSMPNGEPCNKCEACTTITAGRALDVLEIDAASYTSVDTVRETIIETAKFAPSRLRAKVFIIDEVHMLSTSAWNALLKIMEEPPAHVIFILATTEVHKVPATILSRCQRFAFHRIKAKDIVERLKWIASQERVKVTTAVLEKVARFAEGSVRDAESVLEQLFALKEKEITEDVASLILPRTSLPLVLDLLATLKDSEARRGLALINQAVEQGIDLQQFSQDILETLRQVLLIKVAGPESVESGLEASTLTQLQSLAEAWGTGKILGLIDWFGQAKQGLKGAHIPQLPLEVAVVEGCGVTSSASIVSAPLGTRSVAEGGKVEPSSSPRSSSARGRAVLIEPTQAGLRVSSGGTSQRSPRSEVERKKSVSLEELKLKWSEVLKRVQEENHSLPFLLSTSEPTAVEGDTVQVSVQYPFHRDKLNEPKCRLVLEKVLGEVCSAPVKVLGVVREASRKTADAVEEVLDTLGGKVVE